MQVTIEGVLCEMDQHRSEGTYGVRIRDKKRDVWLRVDHETAARLSRLLFRRVTVTVEGDPDGDVCFPPKEDDSEIPFA